MKKFEGNWKNHVKEGQKKVNKILVPTSDFQTSFELADANLFDGFGITRKDIEQAQKKYAKYLQLGKRSD